MLSSKLLDFLSISWASSKVPLLLLGGYVVRGERTAWT